MNHFLLFLLIFSSALQLLRSQEIFVTRRPLLTGKLPTISNLAHSAILFKNANNKCFLIEYMGTSSVDYYEQKPCPTTDQYDFNGWKWIKQSKGVKINPAVTAYVIQSTMIQLSKIDLVSVPGLIDKKAGQLCLLQTNKQYSLIDNNCHIIQESVRLIFGWAKPSELSYLNFVNRKIRALKILKNEIPQNEKFVVQGVTVYKCE